MCRRCPERAHVSPTEEAGGQTSKVTPEPRMYYGQQWIYVLFGHMRFVLGDQDQVLGRGDVAAFDTTVPHWSAAQVTIPRRSSASSDGLANECPSGRRRRSPGGEGRRVVWVSLCAGVPAALPGRELGRVDSGEQHVDRPNPVAHQRSPAGPSRARCAGRSRAHPSRARCAGRSRAHP